LNRVEEFTALLTARARKWSEVLSAVKPRLGLRIVKLTGALLSGAVQGGFAAKMLDKLFEQLPPDACLIDFDGQVIWLDFEASSGTYYDRYCFLVGSAVWEYMGEGEPIEVFQPVFTADLMRWPCDNHLPAYMNKSSRQSCEICGRARR
jgi:hypothetical protein